MNKTTRRTFLAGAAAAIPVAATAAVAPGAVQDNPAFKTCPRATGGKNASRFPQVIVQDQHKQKAWFYEDLIADKLVLVPSEMAQACQRLGLTESAAVTKVKKELSALVGTEPVMLVTVQAHLNRLGDLEEDEWPSAVAEFVR